MEIASISHSIKDQNKRAQSMQLQASICTDTYICIFLHMPRRYVYPVFI